MMHRHPNADRRLPPSRPLRGSGALLGLVIVLAVILLLALWELNGGGGAAGPGGAAPKPGVPPSAGAAACALNCTTIRTNLMPWIASHSGQPVTPQVLAVAAAGVRCPGGGVYLVSKDGTTVYCTLHATPPPGEIADYLRLNPAAATPTPGSSSTLPAGMTAPTTSTVPATTATLQRAGATGTLR